MNQPQPIPSKRVVVLIIDSLMDEPLRSISDQKKVPALRFLMDNGHYYPKMVSSFPTMSVVIDSTLLTGTYSDKHRIPALVWYDTKEKRFISYGSALKEIMKLGPKQVLTESLFHLNGNHLSPNVKTLHEEINGQTASINTLVYRGNHVQQLNVPTVTSIIGLLEDKAEVNGPSYFSYGLLSRIDPKNKHTHLWDSFGFNDKFATKELNYLISNKLLPSFSIVYYSDNDKEVHKKGVNVTKGIEDTDKQLQEVLNSYPSWEDALKDTVWIVMGDSGQTDVGKNKNKALIDLRKLLKDYAIHKIGKPVQDKDEIVLGLNERMSFIYLLDENISTTDIVEVLRTDERIQNISWKEGEVINVVSTDHNGILSYKPTGGFTDLYGQTWSLKGNVDILDLKINKDKNITYNDFPDGLARLYSSFYSHPGNYLVVNAKPGFEFIGEGSPTHAGGAGHGSLHKQDTYVPMIVAGTDEKPKHERILDMKEWIFRILEQPN
ncbi:alkaline phosphatase family protein [Mesobacillus foraminis]|uniref:alkaline phosphatase family protein n=1 Tax=Mesobacillus foraminis TaxID=279826 RepID=UPI00214BA1BE|nr:alkaline phosphatase family protein [Mesobacillus foraminis]